MKKRRRIKQGRKALVVCLAWLMVGAVPAQQTRVPEMMGATKALDVIAKAAEIAQNKRKNMKTVRVMKQGPLAGAMYLAWLMTSSLPAQHVPGSEMMGAAKALDKIALASASTNQVVAVGASAAARDQFKKDLDLFKKSRAELPPEKAAATWLSLFDRFWVVSANSASEEYSYNSFGEEGNGLSFKSVVVALPEPGAWDALAALVEQRTAKNKDGEMFETTLRLFTDYLTGSIEKLQKDVATFESRTSALERYQHDNAMQIVGALRKYVQLSSGENTSESMIRELEKCLEAQRASNQAQITIKIPDLVTMVGEKRAEALIVSALETPKARLEVEQGDATMALARRLCLEHIDSLQEPQWALVNSPDALALYEQLAKKFPMKTPDSDRESILGSDLIQHRSFNEYGDSSDSDRTAAQSYYLIGLLLKGRMQDALALVTGMKNDEMERMLYDFRRKLDRAEDAVPPDVLFDFFEALYKAKGDSPLSSEYIDLAMRTGRISRAIQLLSGETARTDLSFDKRAKAHERLASAYLAVDRIDDAGREFHNLLQMDFSKEKMSVQTSFELERMELGIRFARLGRLLDKPDWLAEGIAAYEDVLNNSKTKSSRDSYRYTSSQSEFCEILVTAGQYAKAEAYWVEAISAKLKNTSSRYSDYSEPESLQSELTQLAGIYYRAGRYRDILELLEKAPWWGASDLVNLGNNSSYSADTPALAIMAAEGLCSAGRVPEAINILNAYIYQSPGDDDAYALLIKISPDNLVPWLDSLYQRDRFEERPLIWKAHLLMKQGQLDEAEKIAREALRVDPTDGETKDGNRVRGYAVLADILAAKGKQDDAKFFQDVVKSVRIAEEGDALTSAGLTTRSIVLYEKAQAYFVDAYCVQWRLAKRFDELGKTEEAEKHYRIAFERMPEQFGQVASFCFGCEGAFDGKHSQSVAETVLLGLEKKGPPRPQVYYLLGQLREAQNRNADAYAYYKKAVAIDPGYLDVWDQIASLAERISLTPAERDDISLTILRMDPMQRHTSGNIEKINDLPKLWALLQDARQLNIEVPKSLLPLTASAAQAAKETKDQDRFSRMRYSYYDRYSTHRVPEPGEAIAENEIVGKIMEAITIAASPQSLDDDD